VRSKLALVMACIVLYVLFTLHKHGLVAFGARRILQQSYFQASPLLSLYDSRSGPIALMVNCRRSGRWSDDVHQVFRIVSTPFSVT